MGIRWNPISSKISSKRKRGRTPPRAGRQSGRGYSVVKDQIAGLASRTTGQGCAREDGAFFYTRENERSQQAPGAVCWLLGARRERARIGEGERALLYVASLFVLPDLEAGSLLLPELESISSALVSCPSAFFRGLEVATRRKESP